MLSACEQDPSERRVWRWQQAWLGLRAEDLVFVDESGSNQAMAPRDGSALKGERSPGEVPRNRGRTPLILAAMGRQGLVGTMTVEGATNKEVFWTYLDQGPCPALRPGQIVGLDNLAAHKNEAGHQKLEAGAARLLFLLADSPDFNPVEHAFAKLKAFLRKAKARTPEALEAAIAAALATITAQNARSWFKHCEFPPAVQSF